VITSGGQLRNGPDGGPVLVVGAAMPKWSPRRADYLRQSLSMQG
jgi:hypothetical protein